MKSREEKEQNRQIKEWKKARRKRNRELYLCTAGFLVLFAVLFVYLTDYVTSNHEELFNNSYNSRQRVLAAQNRRGTIYSADGEILAQTVTDEQGNETREYPFKEVFAHVVGYTAKGKTGIEELENYNLINSDISEKDKIDNELAGIKNPGNDVYATLDTKLQKIACDALGAYQGAIVVTEVKTGRILAMVSKPDYDPNNIAAIWDKVSTDTENAVLINRATQGLYPPGSTFKIVTALAYIRQNSDTWQSYSYLCNGTYVNGENKISCFHGSVHGSVNFMESLAKSCNCSFANIGMSLDRGQFEDTINSLLFNQKLPIELPYNQTSVELSQDSSDEDLIQTSIGQGKTQISPMQLNMITAAIANEGTLMTPYLIDKVVSAEGKIIQKNSPSAYQQLLTKEEAQIMTTLLEDVVKEGTARKLNDRSYTAAGKTGSAEFNQVKEDSHAWFTGFAPVEDPEIAVTVIVEKIGSGGDYAVPLAGKVFDAYFSE
ncbi:MAG: penicillin-binding protein 2 [Lachnospiraceae bacterium]|nr:penicillin-binding protein 2 [Lachnospiraceae bacterium]